MTNNGIIIAPFSTCGPTATAALQIGTASRFTVGTTWYQDTNLATVAGTYSPNTFTPTQLAAGTTYPLYFTVNDPTNGCSRPVSTFVTVNAAPTAVLSGDATICSGNSTNLSVALTGTGPWSMAYSDGTTTTNATATSSPFSIPVNPASNKTYTLTTVSDANCAGTVTGSAVVMVNIPPVLTVPTLAAVSSEASQCGAIVAFAASGTPAPAITYKVGDAAIMSPYFFPVGTTTVTATATNSCGRDEKTFTVTVEDKTTPIAKAKPITIQLDAAGTASITTADVNDGSSDNCTAATALVLDLDKTSFNCSNIGANTVTLTVTDASGNVNTAQATLTVKDNTVPVITTNGNQSVSNDAGTCGALVAVSGSASDNCTVGNPTGVRSDGKALTELYPVGTTTITWNVSDANGNAAAAVLQTVTVKDNTVPTAKAKPVTVELNAAGQATVTVEQINDGSSDACGIKSISLSKTSFGCSNIGANTITLTVTDVNDNVNTTQATVTVTNAAPTLGQITGPIDPVPVNTVVNLSVPFTDTNLQNATWKWDDGAPIAGTITGSTVTGSHTYTTAGVYSVMVTVTDVCGSTASAIYKYIVNYDPSAGFVTGGGWIMSPQEPT